MRVNKDNLLVIAGAVWIIAGINVVNLGVRAALDMGSLGIGFDVLLVIGALVVLGGFHLMFGKIVKKNSARIRAFEEPRQNPFRFLDVKGYLIMGFMMTLGFGLRASGFVPDWFIAFFYTGLGTALVFAGIGFLMHRCHQDGWSFHTGHSLHQNG